MPGLAVLDDVGEGLTDHEICGGLHPGRQTPGYRQLNVDGYADLFGYLRDGCGQSVVGQDLRVYAVYQLP